VLGFELDRRPIGQSRVQALAIIHLLDERADGAAGVVGITVGPAVNLLVLERLHEALRLGVVVRIADAAHAGADAVSGEDFAVAAAGILHALIGVMDETVGRRAARLKRHGERRDRQPRLQISLQRPADDAPAEGVEHHREISELLEQADVGDVGD